MEEGKKINRKLRAARLQKRWTIKEAADNVGIVPLTFMRWERGQQNPQLASLDLLCNTFKMSPKELGFGYLVGEDDDVLSYNKPTGPQKGREQQQATSCEDTK